MSLIDPTGVPIVGQTTSVIPQQLRVDAHDNVGKMLETHKQLGLRFGRIVIPSGAESASAQLLLALEYLEAAGCRIVTIAENVVDTNRGQMVAAAVYFRVPESLFNPPNA